jgi:HEPN domain-containing protein
MRNRSLAGDYVRRAEARLLALDVLFTAASWADVVRESQETLELALKGLLRQCGIEPPRVHDVSEVLVAEQHRLPELLQPEVERLARHSKTLRRDRELAFYGAEDLTPSDFYSEQDAADARDAARLAVSLVRPHVPQVNSQAGFDATRQDAADPADHDRGAAPGERP